MPARPTWQGHLKLSLVTCPVALYTATTKTNDVSFHLINPKTNNRIRMVPTDPDAGPVERSDLVKGYEVSKDEYVLFENADFDKVKLESTRTIDIEQFVDADDIDRLYWGDPLYVVPDKGVGAEAFAVIREAMAKQNKIAIGALVPRAADRPGGAGPGVGGVDATGARRGARRRRLFRRHPGGEGRQGHGRHRRPHHRAEGRGLRSVEVQGPL